MARRQGEGLRDRAAASMSWSRAKFKAGARLDASSRARDAGRRHDPRRRAEDRSRTTPTCSSRCRTLLWNGPLGAFEIAPFGEGTFALAREAARADQGRPARLGRRRRRYGRGAQCGGRHRRVHLRLDGGRRLPRMARGPRAAGHRRAGARSLMAATGPLPKRRHLRSRRHARRQCAATSPARIERGLFPAGRSAPFPVDAIHGFIGAGAPVAIERAAKAAGVTLEPGKREVMMRALLRRLSRGLGGGQGHLSRRARRS